MMMNNNVNCFLTTFETIPLPGWNPLQSSVQANIPANYQNSPYQQQQQQQGSESPAFYKIYDFEGNKKTDIIRLMFYYAGVSFKDKHVKQDEWERVKVRIPIQQLPILRINNQFKIYYLNTIIRYLAREFRLYGSNNIEHTLVDIILEFNQEFQMKLFERIGNISNDDESKEILKEFFQQYGIDYLKQLEDFYEMFNSQGPFYLNNQISLADLIVYQTINYFLDIDSKLLDNYSHLQQARFYLDKHPQIINYLNNKNKPSKIDKQRHKSVPPLIIDNHHRRCRRSSDSDEKPFHRRHSKESMVSTVRDNESTVDLPIQQIPKPPSVDTPTPLQIKQDFKPPNIETPPPLETKQDLRPSNVETPSLSETNQNSRPPSIETLPPIETKQNERPPSVETPPPLETKQNLRKPSMETSSIPETEEETTEIKRSSTSIEEKSEH